MDAVGADQRVAALHIVPGDLDRDPAGVLCEAGDFGAQVVGVGGRYSSIARCSAA